MSNGGAESGGAGGGSARRGGGDNNNNDGGRGGRTNNGGRGGGRGSNRGNNNNHNNKPKHKHNIKEMGDHVFSVRSETLGHQAIARYVETSEELEQYISRSGIKGCDQVADAVKQMNADLMIVEEPEEPDDDAGPARLARFNAKMKLVVEKEDNITEARKKFFADIFELCEPEMKNRLKKLQDWGGIRERKCVVELLGAIRNQVCEAGDRKHAPTVVVGLIKMFYEMKQGNTPVDVWAKQRLAMIKAIDDLGGSVCSAPGLEAKRASELAAAENRDEPNEDDLAQAKEEVMGQMEAALILSGSSSRYDSYQAELSNSYLNGIDNYPRSAVAAVESMSTYIDPYALGRERDRRRNARNGGQGGNQDGQRDISYPRHLQNDDDDDQEGLSFMQQRSRRNEPVEPEVTDVEERAPSQPASYAQAVSGSTDRTVDDPGAVILVQTVRKNFEGFTLREVERAISARRAQSMSGHPSEQVLKREVSRSDGHSLFRDCPISSKDVDNANKIFGPSLPIVKGKERRGKPDRVDPEYISIPQQVLELNKFLTLVADVMFVNGLPFFVTLSRNIRFMTVKFVPRRTAVELANTLKESIMLYRRAGYVCQTALMDGEFAKLQAKLSDEIVINTCSKNEHVGEIEAKLKDVKNRCRSIIASLPFSVLPNAIVTALVHHAVMMMNAFPASQGVSQQYSPRELVLRWQLSFQKHCQAPFGSYCTVYHDPDVTNDMTERCFEGINLGPTGNMQGTHKFLCLSSGNVLKRRQFKERPMPDSVINLINDMGTKQKQEGRLRFHNRHNKPFSWTDEDENEILIEDNAPESQIAPFPSIPAEEPGIPLAALSPPTEVPVEDADVPIEDADAPSAFAPPHVEAIFQAATGRPAAAPGASFQIDVVPAEADEVEPPDDDDSLPPQIDHDAAASSDESNAYAPEPDEPGDHDLNFADSIADDTATDEGVAAEDADAGAIAAEEYAGVAAGVEDAGVRRSGRARAPIQYYHDDERYMHVTVSKEKVNVMNPRMFSNAAVNHVTMGPITKPSSKLADASDLEPMEQWHTTAYLDDIMAVVPGDQAEAFMAALATSLVCTGLELNA